MARSSPGSSRWTSWSCALAVMLYATGAAAQQPPSPGISQSVPSADFMFGAPRVTLGVRGAFVFPREGSDLFEFVQDQLTVDKGDFKGPAFAFDIGVPVSSRMDVVAGMEFARASVSSEYRDFVDNAFLPIQQDSKLSQNSLIGSVRFMLTPRGTSVGRFAWIPATLTPYVGGGGGLVWWNFEQTGDFVDFQDLSVFSDTFNSSGTSPEAHVFGGVDVQIYQRLMVSFEGRYQWAKGTLSNDFIDFDPIDLSGFRLSAGINILF